MSTWLTTIVVNCANEIASASRTADQRFRNWGFLLHPSWINSFQSVNALFPLTLVVEPAIDALERAALQ